jgi:hypothetical protein
VPPPDTHFSIDHTLALLLARVAREFKLPRTTDPVTILKAARAYLTSDDEATWSSRTHHLAMALIVADDSLQPRLLSAVLQQWREVDKEKARHLSSLREIHARLSEEADAVFKALTPGYPRPPWLADAQRRFSERAEELEAEVRYWAQIKEDFLKFCPNAMKLPAQHSAECRNKITYNLAMAGLGNDEIGEVMYFAFTKNIKAGRRWITNLLKDVRKASKDPTGGQSEQ